MLAVGAPPLLAADGQSPVGLWKNDAEGWVVETFACRSGICGRLVGFRPGERGPDPKDTHNPNPAARYRPLCGMVLLGGFAPARSKAPPGGAAFEGGWIYDPVSGSTYSGQAWMTGPDTMELRGYVGMPFFGRTLTMTRTHDITNRCSNAGQQKLAERKADR